MIRRLVGEWWIRLASWDGATSNLGLRGARRSSAAASAMCVLVLLGLLCASAFAADTAQLTVLPNGLRVLTQEVHSAPVVSVYTWYRVGSRNESTGITGISHFCEHMLFKGTQHFGPGEISRLITRTGGWDNGFTWLDYTAYVETLPARDLDLALRIESDRMERATFAPNEVESEKTVVLSELEGDENDPGFYLSEAVRAAAFMAHPYHWPTIGWKSDVLALDRAKAYHYYDTYYAPDNATLVIVGDFQTEPVLKRVRELFGVLPARTGIPEVVTVEPPQQGERRVMVRRPGASGMIEMAFHVPAAGHPDHYALDVVETVLGTGRTSRLYQALVEKKLAVDADSYNYTNRDPSLFLVDMTLADGVSHADAEKAALAEIDRLAADLVSDRDLQRAKNQAKASFIYGTDSVSSLGYRLGFFDIVANFRLLYEYVARIEAVTPEQVRDVVRRYLTADNRTVGWFIPTGAAPAGPSAPPGPVSRSRPTAPSRSGVLAWQPQPSRHRASGKYGGNLSPSQAEGGPMSAGRLGVHGEGLDPHLYPLPDRETSDATRPQGAAAGAPRREPFRFQLDNGAIFIVYENPVVPVVSVNGMVGGGMVFDPAAKPGLANFVAQMLSRGAGDRTWKDIADALEFVAADVSIGGGIQVANASARCLKDDLPLLMEILADEIRRPTFPEDQVTLVRSQLEVAIREALQDTGAMAEREFYATLYPEGHPLHNRPLGTLEGVQGITRDDLISFHQRYYRPDTLILAVVGDVTPDQVRELAQKYFGDWTGAGERPQIVMPQVPAPAEVVRKSVHIAGKTQSDIVIGLPGIARTAPDYPAAELLNYTLGGGGFSSRLTADIRDKQGLAYYVYSYFAAYKGPGPWLLRMGVNPARVDRAIDAALADMRGILKEPPGDAELRLWKDYVTGQLALQLETNAGIASSLAEAEFYGLGLDYPWRYPQIIGALTPKDVAEAARRYIQPDHCIIIIAGPETPPEAAAK
jgi:zinc protease